MTQTISVQFAPKAYLFLGDYHADQNTIKHVVKK